MYPFVNSLAKGNISVDTSHPLQYLSVIDGQESLATEILETRFTYSSSPHQYKWDAKVAQIFGYYRWVGIGREEVEAVGETHGG
jgi:hypothetical protein